MNMGKQHIHAGCAGTEPGYLLPLNKQACSSPSCTKRKRKEGRLCERDADIPAKNFEFFVCIQ
jgi:hypothetical protein